jgi:hypothetical protein
MHVAPRPELVIANNGKPTLRINGVFIHSIDDPDNEALGWARDLFAERALPKDALWIIFGVGLGYHLQALLDCGITDILAFEPDRHVAALWRTNNITLPTGTHVEITDSIAALQDAFQTRHLNAASVQMMAIPAYARLYPRQLTDFHAHLDGYMQEYKTGCRGNRFRSHHVSLATVENIPTMLTCPSIQQLRDLAPYLAAVIVSPGPSLDTTLKELSLCRERFIVLAPAQNLRPLVAAGIRPDLTLVTDATPMDSYLQGCPHDYFRHLVLSADCHPLAAELPAERKFFFYSSPNPLAEKIYALRGENAADLPGHSTEHVAFNLALAIGADPILLLGQIELRRFCEVAAKLSGRPPIDFAALIHDLPMAHATELERVLAGLMQLHAGLKELTCSAAACLELAARCRQALVAGNDVALAELEQQEQTLNELVANHPEIQSVIQESLQAARDQGERQSDDLLSSLELSQILYEIIQDGSSLLQQELEPYIKKGMQ